MGYIGSFLFHYRLWRQGCLLRIDSTDQTGKTSSLNNSESSNPQTWDRSPCYLDLWFVFSCILPTRTPSAMLNTSGGRGHGHPCLLPNLWGKMSSLLAVTVMLAEGSGTYSLTSWVRFFYSYFTEKYFFNYKWVLHFIKCFFCISALVNIILWFFFVSLLMW